jgi:hypothetical protein
MSQHRLHAQKERDLPYSSLATAALAHPTMAEGLGALFSDVPPTQPAKSRAA